MNAADPTLFHFSTAEATLLLPNELDMTGLDAAFGLLAAHRVDDADLYFQ